MIPSRVAVVPKRRTLALAVLATGALALAPLAAQAQGAFPSKALTIVVPFSAGGTTDIAARMLAVPLGAALGQTVVVENRSGASGAIAAIAAKRAEPDGYTLLLTTTAIYAILPNLRKNLPFDPPKDFVPVTRIATASNVLVVNNDVPAKDIAQLVKFAKDKPGALNYASAGVGTPAHLAGEMLNLLADIKVTHVPYKGAAPALTDVIAGNVQENQKADLPDQFTYAFGADVLVAPRLSVIVDLFGQRLIDSPRMISTTSVRTGAAGSVTLDDIQFVNESYWSAAGSFGMKGNVVSRMLVTFNLRFALTDGGLTDRLSPLLGVEWSF